MSSGPRFGKRRWRRPERMMLEGPDAVRRKDLGVSEPMALETELVRRTSRRQLEILMLSFFAFAALEGIVIGFFVRHPVIGAATGVALAAAYFLVTREFGDTWFVRILKAKPVDGTRTLRLASSEARSAGIPAPRVLVSPGDVPNALSFALRRRWIVTTQAAEQLDELALEGVLAHEIVHLRDGEATVASLFVALCAGPELVLRGAGVLPALSLPLWPSAMLLRLVRPLVTSRDREHRADIAGALLTRYPPGIEAALRAAGGDSAGLPLLDPFWFVARDGRAAAETERRAALVAEM